MSHTYKKISKPVPAQCRITDAVKRYGDHWRIGLDPRVSPHTQLAMGSRMPGADDSFIMEMCEKGVLPRVGGHYA